MSEPLTEQELAEMEARVRNASPGPWTRDDGDWSPNHMVDADGEVVVYDEGAPGTQDAAFIAAARTDLPRLIAEVRRLRSFIDRMADMVENEEPEVDWIWDGEDEVRCEDARDTLRELARRIRQAREEEAA